MHLMYEWENERHIPATWASDGEEICHYDPRLSTNNSSLSFAYPTIPLWILDLCSWIPTMYQNGTVYGREGGEYLPKDANKHLPSRKFLSSIPLTIFWNSSPTHCNRQVSYCSSKVMKGMRPIVMILIPLSCYTGCPYPCRQKYISNSQSRSREDIRTFWYVL